MAGVSRSGKTFTAKPGHPARSSAWIDVEHNMFDVEPHGSEGLISSPPKSQTLFSPKKSVASRSREISNTGENQARQVSHRWERKVEMEGFGVSAFVPGELRLGRSALFFVARWNEIE